MPAAAAHDVWFAAPVTAIFSITLIVFVPFIVVTMVSVRFGSTSVPTKEAVLLPVILTTGALAGAQVKVDPVTILMDGAMVKLDPAGALQA